MTHSELRANDPDVIVTECEQLLLDCGTALFKVNQLTPEQRRSLPEVYWRDLIGAIAALRAHMDECDSLPPILNWSQVDA